MAIEIKYEKQEDIPAGYADLYTQEGETWVLTGVTGMVTQNDVDTVKEALRKEREDHKKSKERLRPWDGLEAAKVRADLARIPELEAAAKDAPNEEKIEEMVTARIGQKTGPLEQQIRDLTKERDEGKEENAKLQLAIVRRDRNDVLRSAAVEAKVLETAVDDVLVIGGMMMEQNDEGKFVTKDGITGITPGLNATSFMKEMEKIRPHWWPASEGGGAGGGRGGGARGGPNPFTHAGWNLTEQGRLFAADPEEAKRLATQAGTTVGGRRPPAKAA